MSNLLLRDKHLGTEHVNILLLCFYNPLYRVLYGVCNEYSPRQTNNEISIACWKSCGQCCVDCHDKRVIVLLYSVSDYTLKRRSKHVPFYLAATVSLEDHE
jgi:hypothetical protein